MENSELPIPPKLCDTCTAFQSAWNELDAKEAVLKNTGDSRQLDEVLLKDTVDIYIGPGNLPDGVRQECPLCAAIWESLSAGELEYFSIQENDSNMESIPQKLTYCRELLEGGNGGIWVHDEDFNLNCSLRLSEVNESNPSCQRYVGASTGSDECVQLVTSWLEGCTSNHAECQRSLEFMPTRLIDVGTEDDSNISLILSESLPAETEYLTLSHCWGESLLVRSLTSNLEEMMNGIPLESLTQTFEDAVIFTRKMGYRFIWIDCLCIIQDKPEDWLYESSRMRDVYKHALLNLAATSAPDSSYGLFSDREKIIKPQHPIMLNKDGHETSYQLVEKLTWFYKIEMSPLNDRAWVCQERFLSTCNLHFTTSEIYWECKHMSASERFPDGITETTMEDSTMKQQISKALDDTTHQTPRLLPRDKHGTNADGPSAAWNLLLSKYTQSALTFASDRLVAIAGLAETRAKLKDDVYLAGLWRNHLPLDLLWSRIDPGDDESLDPTLKQPYIAPSWSWASREGEVQCFDHTSYRPDELKLFSIDIVDTNIGLVGDSPFGQVECGLLRLKASIIAIRCVDMQQFKFRFCLAKSDGPMEQITANVTWDTLINNLFTEEELADHINEGPLLYLFPVVKTFESSNMSASERGLILRRKEQGVSSGEFERLGMFDLTHQKVQNIDGAKTLEDMCKVNGSKVDDFGLEYAEEEEGTLSRCIFTLV